MKSTINIIVNAIGGSILGASLAAVIGMICTAMLIPSFGSDGQAGLWMMIAAPVGGGLGAIISIIYDLRRRSNQAN